MNYQRIHDSIIAKAHNQKLLGYSEKHHIIPKCMGGTNDKENLVKLTARQHFIVHKLLVEAYPDNDKLFYAYWAMCNKQGSAKMLRNYKISSREYERVKCIFAKKMSSRQLSAEHKRKIGEASKQRIHTVESKQKNREAHLGKPSPMLGKSHTVESKQKNREAHLGKTQTAESNQKRADTLKGRIFSNETIIKMQAAQTKRQQLKKINKV